MITLIEAKQYIRMDFADDDAEIADMIEAAVQHLASIGVDVTTEPVPAPLKQAGLMLVSHFYEGRGVMNDEASRLSPAFFRLIAPYREIML
ncbi:head-tail connector protein [Oceanicella sp. SM1341]|uniref:head-tail connector protein n=1 Tax=Oceanicella sp. SM1341 TaxID=1548889 RepID=UPI000E545277|nr:head-tail connector protein [Oceanicella sp. SM1341]